jgi:hypothetical protein
MPCEMYYNKYLAVRPKAWLHGAADPSGSMRLLTPGNRGVKPAVRNR